MHRDQCTVTENSPNREWTWAQVEAAFRTHASSHGPGIETTALRGLALAQRLQSHTRLGNGSHWVSHLSLMVASSTGERNHIVRITWSEPGTIAWGGETGYQVARSDGAVDSWDEVIVGEETVEAAILDRLASPLKQP